MQDCCFGLFVCLFFFFFKQFSSFQILGKTLSGGEMCIVNLSGAASKYIKALIVLLWVFSKHFTKMSLSKTIIYKSPSSTLNMFVIIIMLTSSLCVRMVTSSSQVLTSRCASCDISELDDETFVWRYLGACMVCGEFYGSVVERCCMCNQQWFKDCQFWTGVDHLKQPDIKKYIH